MDTITTKDTWGKEKTYKVAEKIPAGYKVWNIGKNMGHDEYIPVCVVRSDFHIVPETLLAVHMEKQEVETLRVAANRGIDCLEAARRISRKVPKNPSEVIRSGLASAALEVFEKYTEKEEHQ